jgi:hypothetical protein
VGRLPAASVDEVVTMVEKILVWESQEAGPQLLFLSGEESEFSGLSEDLAELVPDPIHIDAGADGTRDQAVDVLARGPVWANYTGHGSVIRLDSFLTREDGAAWREPGVMVAWTCLAAHFAHPTEPSMAEVWLRDPESGVAAFFGPVGETMVGQQRPLAETFYRTLPEVERIGDAWSTAMAAGLPHDVQVGYVLLGDPAMRTMW